MHFTPQNQKSSHGFTIVELLIVIVIIAVLAAITIVAYNGITARANTARALSNATSVKKVAEAFNAEAGRYPQTTTDLVNGFGSSPATKLPAGITVVTGTSGANGSTFDSYDFTTAANGTTTVSYSCYLTCVNSTGGRLRYWDYTTGTHSTNVIYLGAAGPNNGAFYIPNN
jgi:prepilin-type N-terminal cleavage/methylation domain-containing protein